MKLVVMMPATNPSASVLNSTVRSTVSYTDAESNTPRNISGLLKGRREFAKSIFKELHVIDRRALYSFLVESSFNLVKLASDDGKADFWQVARLQAIHSPMCNECMEQCDHVPINRERVRVRVLLLIGTAALIFV